jgi:tRNA threonylcarbamoyl adenosine modification protein YjeE
VTTALCHASSSGEATERIGETLAATLEAGAVVLLSGDLAAGKTTLVRGLVRGLGGDAAAVTSPSFVLLQTYPCRTATVHRLHHLDLYRLADRLGELREVGVEEALSDPAAVVAVEWPKDTLAAWIPRAARVWRVRLTIVPSGVREVEITAPG